MLEALSVVYGIFGWIAAHPEVTGVITSLGFGFLIPRTWTEKLGYWLGKGLQKILFRKSGMGSDKKLWNNVRNTLHDFFKGFAKGLGAKIT